MTHFGTISQMTTSALQFVSAAYDAVVLGKNGDGARAIRFIGTLHVTVGAKATNLNKHGGAIQMTRELLVGTTVIVRNKRGTQISARVVSQISAEQGLLRYGIEFVEEDTRALSSGASLFLQTRKAGMQGRSP